MRSAQLVLLAAFAAAVAVYLIVGAAESSAAWKPSESEFMQ